MPGRRGSRARKQEGGGGASSWLTTFNDLVTNLMVFFVLVYSMSSVDAKRMKHFQESLQSGLGVLKPGSKTAVSVVDESDGRLSRDFNDGKQLPLAVREGEKDSEEEILRAVQDIVMDHMAELGGKPGLLATRTDAGIVLTLADAFLFESGRSEINPQVFERLNVVRDIICSTQSRVRIEGHTDNIPITTAEFASNWELSSSRAVNVLKYLVKAGAVDPRRFSAVGYGDSRPVAPNDTLANRAKNRRVEIVLVK